MDRGRLPTTTCRRPEIGSIWLQGDVVRVLAPLASVGAAAGDARLLRPPARRHPPPRRRLPPQGILGRRPGRANQPFILLLTSAPPPNFNLFDFKAPRTFA